MIKYHNFFFIVFCALMLLPKPGLAFSFTPTIVDAKGKPAEVTRATLTLVNESSSKLNIYGFDRDIGLGTTRVERHLSLADWIYFPTTLELMPKSEKTVELEITPSRAALPGFYHAEVSFVAAHDREYAQRSAFNQAIAINFEVLDNKQEVLEITKFLSLNPIQQKLPLQLIIELTNSGDTSLTPIGGIRFYDRVGKEVTEVPFQSVVLKPGQKHRAIVSFASSTVSVGRYKAFLDLRYGNNNIGSVQDSAYFWYIPLQKIAFVYGGGIALILGLIFVHHRSRLRTLEAVQ